MIRFNRHLLLPFLLLVVCSLAFAQEKPVTEAPAEAPAPTVEYDISQLVWETNMDDPPIGDPERAIRGGIFNESTTSYPLTFRPLGPNANEMWANWRNSYMQAVGLVMRHPQTDNYIPIMATHWSIQDDNRTVFFRLNPEARWSDGEPITADDYVFALETYRNPFVFDPFVAQYAEEYFESVEAVEPHLLKIVGKQKSWRPLEDYAIAPLPRHAMVVDEDWVTRDNYVPPVVQGPYVIDLERSPAGERMELVRLDDWWGNNHPYLAGMYNPDRIVVQVIGDQDRAFDFFKTGKIDLYPVNTARLWATQLDIPEIQNNWAHRRELYVDTPQGLYGIAMNLNAPVFQDKDFRKALQYMFNFDSMNRELMFNAYFRAVSIFQGTLFQNPNLEPYGFDPAKAREHLKAAGYTQRGRDGILVKDPENETAAVVNSSWINRYVIFFSLAALLSAFFGFFAFRGAAALVGKIAFVLFLLLGLGTVVLGAMTRPPLQRASFTLSYGSRGLERHLTVVQNDFRRAGIEMKLQHIEPSSYFNRVREKATEAFLVSMTASYYPAPHQYFSSEFAHERQTNNFWSYSNPEVDALIDIYRFNMNEEERIAAMHRLDEIIQDEAFIIPFWSSPFMRFAYWDYVDFPEYFYPKRASTYMEYPTYWIDPEKKQRLQEARDAGRALPPDPIPVQFDPHSVRPE